MRVKTLISLFLLIFLISCVPTKVRMADKKWLEERLTQRVDEFQTNYLENKPEKVRQLMLSERNKKGLDDKISYEDYLAKDGHMSKYHEVKYKIEGVEIRCKKAKVGISYLVKVRKDADIMKAAVIDYWVFEDDDWYFSFGGKPEFFKIEGWW